MEMEKQIHWPERGEQPFSREWSPSVSVKAMYPEVHRNDEANRRETLQC